MHVRLNLSHHLLFSGLLISVRCISYFFSFLLDEYHIFLFLLIYVYHIVLYLLDVYNVCLFLLNAYHIFLFLLDVYHVCLNLSHYLLVFWFAILVGQRAIFRTSYISEEAENFSEFLT